MTAWAFRSNLGRAAIAPGSAALIAVAGGIAVADPGARLFRLATFLIIGIELATLMSAEALVVATVVVFGTSTSTVNYTIAFGSTTLYPTDVVVLLLTLRALIPRDRSTPRRAVTGAPFVLIVLAGAFLLTAGVRGNFSGTPLQDVIRRDIALFYFPLLVFSLSRILRERTLSMKRLWQGLAIAALGLAAWMFLMRALNLPFETATSSQLGQVVTSSGVVRRDFGSAAAFVVYPALAITAIAGLAYGGRSTKRWLLLGLVGVAATLVTLVRGEIFALAASALVILAMRSPIRANRRIRTALQLGLGSFAIFATVLAVNPALGHAILERSLPGIARQSSAAESTKNYRLHSLDAGFRVARKHPNGLGVVGNDQLMAGGVEDPGYLGHSGVTTLLVYGGWGALLAFAAAILAVIRRSFAVTASPTWIHPAFVGIMTMFTIYSISAQGLAGDVWVIGLVALAFAIRFSIGAEGGPKRIRRRPEPWPPSPVQ